MTDAGVTPKVRQYGFLREAKPNEQLPLPETLDEAQKRIMALEHRVKRLQEVIEAHVEKAERLLCEVWGCVDYSDRGTSCDRCGANMRSDEALKGLLHE